MQISGASDTATQAVMAVQAAKTSNTAQSFQVGVLKKALDNQSEAALKLLEMMDPKGRIIDIRA
jgi:hypothetical protein